MSDSESPGSGSDLPKGGARDVEDALRRGFGERDAVLRDAEQSEPDALREERALAGYRAIARSTPGQTSDVVAGQEATDSRAPSWVGSIRWRSIVGLAAAALIAAVALWDLDREDPGGAGTDVQGMRTLGDPTGIHVLDGILRWPAIDGRADYTIRFVDPAGVVQVETLHSEKAEVRLPPRFQSLPDFEVTIRTKRESGEVSILSEALGSKP